MSVSVSLSVCVCVYVYRSSQCTTTGVTKAVIFFVCISTTRNALDTYLVYNYLSFTYPGFKQRCDLQINLKQR